MDLLVLAIAFVVILLGAELFTNGIEWFGRKLGLAEGAVGSVLAAVGTALPETMIPIIAIAFGGGGEATEAVGVGAILGRAVHAVDARDVRDRRGRARFRRKRRATGTRMAVDTTVLVHDIRYFVVAYAIAIGAAFLPESLQSLKYVVAVVLIGIYVWYVKGHLDAEAGEATRASSRRSGSARSTAAAIGASRSSRGCGSSTSRCIVALAFIIGGAYLFVGAVDRLAAAARRERAAARARDRADRDRAAREVQLADLGPPGQGHARDGQHHGRDGVPVGDPHRRRARVRRVRVDDTRRTRCWRSRRPAWRSSPSRRSSARCGGAARLDGRALLIGGALYLLYLGLVVLAITGILPIG